MTSLPTQHTSKRKSAKFIRWLERLSQFDYDIKYVKGEENVLADFLSRLPLDKQPTTNDENELSINVLTTNTGISITDLQNQTERDDVLNIVYKYTHDKWPLKNSISTTLMPYFILRDELYIENRMLMRDDRIVVPASLHNHLLTMVHEGHPGIVRMKRQLRKLYWWPGMDKQVEHYVKNCVPCNDSEKSHKTVKAPPQPIPVPDKKWSKLAIDITGPFANAPQHQRFIVVLIDYTTSFPEVLLTGDITSQRLITWIKSVFARFGNPDVLVSDNASNFTSDEFTQFLRSRDILHQPVPVYNPERNGKVESFNKFLKHGIQTFGAAHKKFNDGIEELLFNYRSTPLKSYDDSPAKQLLGYDIRTNYQPRLYMPREQPLQEMQQEQQTKPSLLYRGPYNVGDLVRKRKPIVPKGTSPFTSPFKIIEVIGNYTYRLDDNQIWNAKNLVRYVRPQRRQDTDMEFNVLDVPPMPPLRRSARYNKGVPPLRYTK